MGHALCALSEVSKNCIQIELLQRKLKNRFLVTEKRFWWNFAWNLPLCLKCWLKIITKSLKKMHMRFRWSFVWKIFILILVVNKKTLKVFTKGTELHDGVEVFMLSIIYYYVTKIIHREWHNLLSNTLYIRYII